MSVFAAAILLARLAAPDSDAAPAAGDCSKDPASVRAEVSAALQASGPTPAPDEIARLRGRLRGIRRSDASAETAFLAADLAFAAGDEEEGCDLLAVADDAAPGRLSAPELLRLAARAEGRRRWREAIDRYGELARRLAADGEPADAFAGRLSALSLEEEAAAIAPPASGPSPQARLALADGRRAMASGRLAEAREDFRAAIQLSPGYVEAMLGLAGVEARTGRSRRAIQVAREALAVEPDRFETLTMLSNLLWEEPDRQAKEESLALLDRALGARPESRALLRLSAVRCAEFGDAARAEERLDRYLAKASPKERAEVEPLRASLAARNRPPAGAEEPAPPGAEEPSTAADLWRKAQVYASRGDAASLDAALALLARAEALDPSFARAPELAATIHERRSEWRETEDALRRAVRADPSRVPSAENLARLVERDPNRREEAERAWIAAENAGSTEAVFRLAQSAERAGDSGRAADLLRRYRDEAPEGAHAAEAAAALARLDSTRRARTAAGSAAAAVAIVVAAAAWYRTRTGATLAEWLAQSPASAPEARRIVGRLRHEALQHGGLLLADGADRIESGSGEARRAAAQLLDGRLYGRPGSRGLVAEVEDGRAALSALARGDGRRLNLAHRDPAFAAIARGVRDLERARRSVQRLTREGPSGPGDVARAARLLRRAAGEFRRTSGAALERSVDLAAARVVRIDALEALLRHVADEANRPAPLLERLGPGPEGEELPPVRVPSADWETLWRNLFANALSSPRLGVAAQPHRDAITGESRLRLVLCDDLPETLTTEAVLSRPSDRGLGVVVEILRRNDGSIEVVPSPARGFAKGIAVDVPVVEAPA